MSKSATYPVTINWVEIVENYPMPIIYDDKVSLCDEFNVYLRHIVIEKAESLSRIKSYKSEVELYAYSIKAFLTFLCEQNIDWRDFDDDKLVSFRNWTYRNTLNDSRSKQSENPAKRTTNRKLRVVYEFLTWAQDSMEYVDGLIGLGDDFPINSILPKSKVNDKIKVTDKRKFPKCFERCGEGSRTRYQYSATQEDKVNLIKYFSDSTRSQYIAERNILIMELADRVGWRGGSINSLTVDQFSEKVIEAATLDKISVTPSEQKLGYENSFEVSLSLAVRMNNHIKGTRSRFIKTKGKRPAAVSSSLFLSNKCEAFGDKTITQIFSAAFKMIGSPRGSGIHSFRRKFAQDSTDKEVAYRRKHKLSLAPEDALLIVGQKLGQANMASQEPYIKSRINESDQTLEANLMSQIATLNQELANSHLEIARLVKMIEADD